MLKFMLGYFTTAKNKKQKQKKPLISLTYFLLSLRACSEISGSFTQSIFAISSSMFFLIFGINFTLFFKYALNRVCFQES